MKTQLPLSLPQLFKRFIRYGFRTTAVAIFSCLLIFTASSAKAQTSSVSIWPPILEAQIQPDKSITQVYRIKNLGDPALISASIVPIIPSDEHGHFDLEFNSPPAEFFSLLNADFPDSTPTASRPGQLVQFPLASGQTQELVLKIKPNLQAQETDYYQALVIESYIQGLIGGTGTNTQATIASPILLTISTTELLNRIANIDLFDIKNKLFNRFRLLDSFDPIEFNLTLKNFSKSRLKPIGSISIKNTFKKEVVSLPLNPDHVLINSSRQLRLQQPDLKPAPLIWSTTFPIGRFQATATITPEHTQNTVSENFTFFIIPYKIILLIGSLSLGIFTIYSIKKK